MGEDATASRSTRHSIDARASPALTSTLPDQNLRHTVSRRAPADGYDVYAVHVGVGGDERGLLGAAVADNLVKGLDFTDGALRA